MKKRVTLFLEESEVMALKKLALEHSLTMSQLVINLSKYGLAHVLNDKLTKIEKTIQNEREVMDLSKEFHPIK